MIKREDYQESLDYIKKYWKEIRFYHPRENGIHIGLPHAFIAPSDNIFGSDQFYWDSYFIILGLISSGKHNFARGMVDNFVYLYKRFNIIPSRNRYYNLGLSQPPFLTSMAKEVFKVDKDKKWFKQVMLIAEREYLEYWTGKGRKNHLAYKNLSRYVDHYVNHITAEHESGWDMTSRFHDECLDYLPVDLNSLLYRYEMDLSDFYRQFGNKNKALTYRRKAKQRKTVMNELMWDEKKGFFFDFNFKKKQISNFYSLAGFYPLWAGLVDTQQADALKKSLRKFEYNGGLVNTLKRGISKEMKQWDWPNGWANQQWIVVKGLLDYGFTEDAERVAVKWLDLNKRVFETTGKFWERYNVVDCCTGKEERYPYQWGFGWTNAIFVKLIDEFEKIALKEKFRK